MSDEERSNLRLLPVARPDDEAVVAKKDPSDKFCRHKRALIDETAHRLYCRECGDEIDPLDFIGTLANNWGRVRSDGEAARAKALLAERELAEVERKLRNAKARLRKKGVLLTTVDARRIREQLRALASTLPAVFQEVGDSLPLEKAERLANLHGYRAEDAKAGLVALNSALDDAGVRRF